jgi:archaellum component FlaC
LNGQEGILLSSTEESISRPPKGRKRETMNVGRTTLVLCAMSILLTMANGPAAAGDQQPSTTDKVLRDAKEALEATKQYTLQQKEAFAKTVQVELNELQPKIAEFQKRTSAASAEARKDLQRAIQDLEKKKEEARRKLEEVNQSTSSAWSSLKDGLNAAVEDLKKSYHEAVSKLP